MIYLWTFLAIRYTCRGGYIGQVMGEKLFCGFFFYGNGYPCRADLLLSNGCRMAMTSLADYCFSCTGMWVNYSFMVGYGKR